MKWFKRVGILFGWVFLIFFCLYFPSWKILPTEDKSLNLFAWGGTIDPSLLAAFEKETGITVNLSHYSTNEELQVKMKATGGGDYDLIMPTDYSAAILIKDGLLKPIDKTKLNFWNDLNPSLLNHYFDPDNRYTIPYEWEVYGIAINKDFFGPNYRPTWQNVFAPTRPYRIAFTNDPVEAIQFSSFYLFGETNTLSSSQLNEVKSLLMNQRNFVEAYTDFRGDYFLATGNCPVAVTFTSIIKRLILQFDKIAFHLPEEGSFLTIDSFCMTKGTKKEKYIYRLLNFLYRKKATIQNFENYWIFPATLSPLPELSLLNYEKEILNMTPEQFKKLHFFKRTVSPQTSRDLWVEVKSF